MKVVIRISLDLLSNFYDKSRDSYESLKVMLLIYDKYLLTKKSPHLILHFYWLKTRGAIEQHEKENMAM